MRHRRRHVHRHGRDWTRLGLRCRCGRWVRCSGLLSVPDLPYPRTPKAPAPAVPARPSTATAPVGTPSTVARGTAPAPARSRATTNGETAWNVPTGHHIGRAGRLTPAQAFRAPAER